MRWFVDFRPLRDSPAFRRLWLGSTAGAVGSQLAVLAVLAQVWELTKNPVAVGAVGVAQAVPMVLFGLVGGALADAVDRRRLVLLTTTGQVLAVGLLAAQAFAGMAMLPVVLGLIALQAACGGLGAPARKTFVARLLPEERVSAGIALTHLSFQAAMLTGPALAGLIIGQWGVGACYLLDALSFGAGWYGVLRLPAMRPAGTARAEIPGWRFIWRRPVVRGALLTDVLATVLAMPIALFPAINEERFGGAPQTLGLFLSAIAVGGIGAGAASGLVTRARRPGAVMLVAAGVWGLGLAGVGFAHSLWLALGCLAVAGAADTVSVISRGSIVQLATPDSHRGRVSAVDHIVGVAGPHLGNFRGGLVAGVTSASFALVSGGALCVLGIAWLAAANRSLRRFRRVPRHSDRAGDGEDEPGDGDGGEAGAYPVVQVSQSHQ